jgi:D-inositol-3-phosphate glycosyltransferase
MLSVHTSPLAPLGGRDTGGMNVYIRQLARELASRGVLVDVYTRRADAATPAVQEDVPGFRTITLAAGPAAAVGREELRALVPEFAAAVDAHRRAEGLAYDVLHSHYWLSGLAALRLSRLWDVPWAHMSHTLAVLKDAHRGPHQEPEPESRLRGEDEVLHAADGVVASNEIEREELLRRYDLEPSRVHVAPCGVDLSLFHPGSRRASRERLGLGIGEKIVLYVGRIEPLKGLDTLLAAASILKRRVPGVRALLVGGAAGPGDPATERELARLRALSSELGVDDVVEFCGPVAQAGLPDLYRAADVSVVTSHYESFGMAALEALACGTPVVASRTGGLQSTIRDGRNGFLVPIADERAFARQIERVLCRPELAARLSQEAVRTARRYSWQRVADANLGVYHNLLAPRRAEVPLEVGADLSL